MQTVSVVILLVIVFAFATAAATADDDDDDTNSNIIVVSGCRLRLTLRLMFQRKVKCEMEGMNSINKRCAFIYSIFEVLMHFGFVQCRRCRRRRRHG